MTLDARPAPGIVVADDGTRLAIHELGDPAGRPILMVHGFSSSTQRNWIDAGWDRPLVEAGLRGVALDLRGHGDSERPGVGRYGVERFLGDVDAVLAATGLAGARPGYLGYSMGSRLGWRYAALHPDAFSALALGGLPAGDPFRGLDGDVARRALAGEAAPTGAAAFVVRLATALPENDPDALVALATEVAATPFAPAAHAPSVPTLLMTGDRDEHAADTATLVDALPDGRWAPIPGRNHLNAITSRHFKEQALAFLADASTP
ncbi:alpha/beta fold hydrolase [Agrococcus sp. SGAir0287]|uniref:alpha/beta fold hydrolase n=1 Tax=Agrococcus sp. SGAir0287 TaxID=2070347 RepID=UPI001586934D|nr:alpha/beta hydrolase [Agrococcus sp. SGAir0287]